MKNDEMIGSELKALIDQFLKAAKTTIPDDLPDLVDQLDTNYQGIVGNEPGKIPGSTVKNLYQRSKQIQNYKKYFR